MHDKASAPAAIRQGDAPPEFSKARRFFLRVIPATIFTAMAGAMATAAFRFLRPTKEPDEAAAWIDVATLAQLSGDAPVVRRINIARKAGWERATEERVVYVLPKQNNRVVSSICPHENCSVAWREDARQFFCPCHQSTFAEDGARLTGPARRGLDPLPTREHNGVLQTQFVSFVNNTAERIIRV